MALLLIIVLLAALHECRAACTISPTVSDCSHNNPPLTAIPPEIFSNCDTTTTILLNNNALTVIPDSAFVCFTALQVLNISYNALKSFPGDSFAGVKQLGQLDLSYNRITDIPCAQPLQLSSLGVLNLEHNSITRVCDNAFAQLSALSILLLGSNVIGPFGSGNLPMLLNIVDLSDNKITAIPAGLPTDLRIFNISNNAVTMVAGGTFAVTTQFLSSLDLSGNQITYFGAQAIAGLRQLDSLYMYGNPIRMFEDGAISDLFEINELDFSNEGTITSIGPTGNAFTQLSNLRGINLGGNRITIIPPSSFSQLAAPYLTEIDLSSNQITIVSAGAIQGLSALQSLSLARNPITQIMTTAFSNLNQLAQLDLSGIHTLQSISPSSFSGLPLISAMNLSFNMLTFIPECPFAAMPILRTVDLSHNLITAFAPSALSCLNLVSLSLSNNAITTVATTLFESMTQLQALDLSHQQPTSQTFHLPDGIFLGLTSLTNLSLNDNALQSLPILTSLSALTLLNASNNSLTEVPPLAALTLLSTLDLGHNAITTIQRESFVNLPALSILDLSYNRLGSIANASFQSLSALTSLSLAWNGNITNLSADSFDGLTALSEIALSGNRLRSVPPLSAAAGLTSVLLDHNLITSLPQDTFSTLERLVFFDVSFNELTQIDPYFFSAFANMSVTPAQESISLVQGFCVSSQAPCPPGTSIATVNVNVQGNSLTWISKSAFDTLVPTVTVTVGGSISSCCGLEWMLMTPHITISAQLPLMCVQQGQPLSSFALGQSICTCKATARRNSTSACYSLMDDTSVGQRCALNGCPPQFVPYRTGSSFKCQDPAYGTDSFLLFETACQECLIANCSSCRQGILACDACVNGTALLIPALPTDSPACVATCPSQYRFDNSSATAVCELCHTAYCARCNANVSLCQECTPSYYLLVSSDLSTHCYAQCPSGYTTDEQSHMCVASSASAGVPLLIILIASIGGFLLFVVVALLIIWRARRKQRRMFADLLVAHQTLDDTRTRLEEAENTVAQFRRDWEIDPSELVVMQEVGKGGMGRVHAGTWRGIAVAIKTVRGTWNMGPESASELDHEASMLRSLRHANIVQFYGAGTHPDGTSFLVTELMELGSLTDYLRTGPLEWSVKSLFAIEIAAGMETVHKLGRIHRDLKSGNVLVTAAGLGGLRVKVADFGTATLISNTIPAPPSTAVELDSMNVQELSRTRAVGTSLWMAPEVLDGSPYGQLADVYSYGIVMWEIAAQDQPWAEVTGPFIMADLCALIQSGRRPHVEEEWPAVYRETMQRSWQTSPRGRPTFTQILHVLNPPVERTGSI